jgi:hypothetical protein
MLLEAANDDDLTYSTEEAAGEDRSSDGDGRI